MLHKSLSRLGSYGILKNGIIVARFASDVDSSKLTIELTKAPKFKPPKEELKFGKTTSDHLLEIDWDKKTGWTAPRIRPYSPFQIDPAASVFHYGLECFEGMKAYLDDKDNIRMFRPTKNMERMNSSLKRLYMPTFNGDEWLKCISELLKVEKAWIPKGVGYSLYIRPTAISTYPYVGVAASEQIKLYVITCPVGPYYPTGFNPVKLFADPRYIRAWPGGTGSIKCGGNYAMGIGPQQEAMQKGYAQIMWLFGSEMQVTEVGTMNQFFFWKNKQGEKELITAPLDGTILPGVTRDSILALTRKWGEFKVTERPYSIHDVIAAVNEGRIIEAFGAGTAAIVAPVNGFFFGDKDYTIPLDPKNPSAKSGPLAQRLMDNILAIQYGKVDHEWSVIVK